MTQVDRRLVSRDAWQGTRLRGAPRRLIATLLLVEVAAAAWCLVAIGAHELAGHNLRDLGILLALSLVFEEMSRRVGKMRLLISKGPQPDMNSVWTFAGAIVLPTGYAGLLAVAIAMHMWLRQQRETGQYVYRRVYSAATVVLACLASSTILEYSGRHLGSGGFGLETAATVLVAIVIYTSINRLLISVAVVLAGGPRNMAVLIGTWDDSALEFATLCLGYMTAQVFIDGPWLIAVALVPMVLLQRGALVRQLEETATLDTKTQLLNALAWRQLAQRELTRSRTSNAAILVIDLDNFKAVNDVHGHLIGDAALFEVGRSLTQELRQADLVGRFGGEEFVVMLPELDVAAAFVIAERLRLCIASIHLADLDARHIDGGVCGHALSASVGVAVFPQHSDELAGLLEAADAALFVAKRAGRNRVVFAEEGASDQAPIALADQVPSPFTDQVRSPFADQVPSPFTDQVPMSDSGEATIPLAG
jgi:diguanylate cyclase (GGDEF)-like protein